MSQNIVVIEGTNLPDVWYQALYKAVEIGRDFTIDRGSFKGQKRKELDFIVLRSRCPDVGELLPKLNPALSLDDPVAQDYIDQYMPYLMTGEEKEGEAYTYGQRFTKTDINDIMWFLDKKLHIKELHNRNLIPETCVWEETSNGCDNVFYVNQIELMIWTYKNHGYRNNQMIMQVGQPSDMCLLDPPCLRHIDTRIQAGKLHFYPYFRSWDLWGGTPANLAGIELMKQYCAEQIGVENGEIIATSKGCHLYSYIWEIAELVRGKTSEEFKAEMIAPKEQLLRSGSYGNHISRGV